MQNREEFLASFREQMNVFIEKFETISNECETVTILPASSQERYWIAVHKARELELRVSGHTRCTEQFLDVAGKIANELFKSQE